jgi:aryl-alcohol dehydrogenase-like predicted oxidoreductase
MAGTAKGSARLTLGHSEITVRPIGLGCMGMSQFYGAADDAESIRTIKAACDRGVDFLDTSDVYGAADVAWGVEIRGFGHNEELIGKAIAGRRDDVVLGTKFAAKLDADNGRIVIDGRPEYVAAACDASLRRLGTDVIDLYYYHRLDPQVPIEDTVGAMSELVTAPLGRSALTGTRESGDTFAKGDIRATNPRFSAENLGTNLRPVEVLKEMADAKGCRPGQLALAWLLAQPLDVVPIPGTRRITYLQENIAATDVAISADETAYLAEVFAPDTIVGERYAAVHARTIAR